MKNLSKWQVMPLLFGSGLCALVYQTVWIRELRLVFGASTLAISAVMAIFLGGIGFGSIYLGRYAEKHRLPLKLYGQLEIAITITAAISPLLISLVRFVYIATGGSLAMGSFFSTIFRLILSILVIGGPTFLMGGTLPAMARAFETESDSNRSRLGLLYGINTIGAVFGVILATFFLLEMLGTVATLWATCLLNLLVGGAALLLARKSEPIPVEPAASKVSARSLTLGEISENKEGLLILGVAAFSGFIFLLMELVWYRMLTPLLGGTTYSFGMILAVALLGIGTGGWLYALRRQDTPVGLIGLAVLCVLEATSIAIPFALGDNIALWSILLQSFGIYGFTGNIIWWFIITSIVVLPSAMISGYLFPMLVGLRGDGRNKVAIQTGQVYAWNTVGVIIGSLVGGFYLMPVLGATGCWQMSVVILAILAFGLLCLSFRGKEKGILYYSLPIALIVCSLTLINTKGPTSVWRHSGIGAHRVNFPLEDGLSSYNSVLSWKNEIRSNIVYEIDGKESSIAIGNEDGFTFVINGKTDGNAYLDAATQVMAPMVGAIIHPYLPKKSMVIGVGTGSSSGWLASIPSMVRVDQVELEPSILKVAEYCAPVNNNVMKNPKVRTIIGDGREVLLTSKEKYDLIFSEPSNPYRAGIASLFTREFYQAVANSLEKGGVFSQWVQGYEVDIETVMVIYNTLHAVFPAIEVWVTHPGDLLFVCSKTRITHSISKLRERISREPYKSALLNTWSVTDLEGFFSHYVANQNMAGRLLDKRNYPVNTDDKMLIEFSFAKSFAIKKPDITDKLREFSWQNNFGKPPLKNGRLDWFLVNENFIIMNALFQMLERNSYLPPDAQKRIESYLAFNEDSSFQADRILANWQSQQKKAVYPVEMAMLAEALAAKGLEESLVLANRLLSFFPVDANAIKARYYRSVDNPELAFAHLKLSLEQWRSYPWIIKQTMGRSLLMVLEMATQRPEMAKKLFQLVSRPFSVGVLEFHRKNIMLEIASQLDNQSGVSALSQLEPHVVPWNKAFLQYRADIYRKTGHSLAGKANKDLQKFLYFDKEADQVLNQ